jgi:ADP-glucose pyrophosphorylase
VDDAMMVGEGGEVSDDAELRSPCVIGHGSRVDAGGVVERSVLLPGCAVEENATVTNSILSAGVTVSSGAILDGDVIGQGETVAAEVVG